MQKYQDVVLDTYGNGEPTASITVNESGGSQATIYSDDGITTKTQPFNPNSRGEFSFYAANGRYDVVVSFGGTDYTVSDIILHDESDVITSIMDFGAVGDGVTDDTTALQTAINWLSNHSDKQLIIPAGTYVISDDIYAYYDVSLNPNFNSGTLTGGGISVLGVGQMSRQDYKNATYHGSVLQFAANKGLKTSNAGTQKTWKQSWRYLSVIGNTTGILWDANWSPQWSEYDNLFIGNSNTSTTGQAFYCGDSWSSTFSNMELVGRSDLTSGTSGEGFVFEPNTSGGGNNLFRNITAAYFGANGLRFGAPYDVTYGGANGYLSYWSHNNLVENCQGQYCDTGVSFQHRFADSIISNYWGEHNTVSDITVDNSSQGIKFVNGALNSNTTTTTALVILGGNSGTAAVDACDGIEFDGTFFFCNVSGANYVPGIRRYKAAKNVVVKNSKVFNGGSCFMSVDTDDIGGEVIFENNDYYPEGATSEMAVARRYCYMPTSSTFSDRTYNLRRADFEQSLFSSATFDLSTWRFAPERIKLDTLSNSISVLLPLNMDTAIGRKCLTRIEKRYSANTVTIDAGTGNTIVSDVDTTGAQTVTLSLANTYKEVRHLGSGSTVWIVSDTNYLSTLIGFAVQNSIDLTHTTNSSKQGMLTKNSTRFIHNFNYGDNGTVTTQGQNNFFGFEAGNLTMGSTATNNYEASNNVGTGTDALLALTIGYQNSAYGNQAGYAITSGYQNNLYGYQSGVSINTGYGNTAQGVYSLGGATTGYNNTAIGHQAGRYLSDGTTANASSNTCVYLGHNSKGSTASRANEIVIGASAVGNGSNTLTLGNTSITANYTYGNCTILFGTSIPAGGTAGSGYKFSSTSNFGIFFGSGAPSLSAAKGSLYLRSDGSTTNDRMYVNTDGGTTWTAVTTAA